MTDSESVKGEEDGQRMTIKVSKDVERVLDAAVRGGQFSSADEMVDQLVREYAGRHPARPTDDRPLLDGGEDTSDPLWGLMRDDVDLMDEIVADAYRHRRKDRLSA